MSELKLVEARSDKDSDPPFSSFFEVSLIMFDQDVPDLVQHGKVSAAGSKTYKAMAADLGGEVGCNDNCHQLPMLPAFDADEKWCV